MSRCPLTGVQGVNILGVIPPTHKQIHSWYDKKKSVIPFCKIACFSRFISFLVFQGISASAMHFQAYTLEGLLRWNANRASDAVSSSTKGPETYSGALYHSLNELGDDVLGKDINPDVANVGIYTSECIGVEYVFKVSKVSKFLRGELPV